MSGGPEHHAALTWVTAERAWLEAERGRIEEQLAALADAEAALSRYLEIRHGGAAEPIGHPGSGDPARGGPAIDFEASNPEAVRAESATAPASRAGADDAAQSAAEERQCEHCDDTSEPTRRSGQLQRYCTSRCRKLASRTRKKLRAADGAGSELNGETEVLDTHAGTEAVEAPRGAPFPLPTASPAVPAP